MESTGNPAFDAWLATFTETMRAELTATCDATLERITDFQAVVQAMDTVYRRHTPPASEAP